MQTVLRNEFFSIVIDPHTGAIRSISDYHTRGPRMAQQIAMRLSPHAGGEGDEAAYSVMAADEVTIVSAGPVLGEVVARGRLMSRDGTRLAGFRQTTRVWRGSRVVELLIELEPERMPQPDPWNSYYAARFAWPDPTARLYRGVNMATVPTEATQLESPHFIEVRTEKTRTALLTGGPALSSPLRRAKTRYAAGGPRRDAARRFRLGLAIDPPSVLPAALDFLAPPVMAPATAGPPRRSGWLFHLDVRGVVATHWEALAGEDASGATAGLSSSAQNTVGQANRGTRLAGGPRGFRVRLLETDGGSVQVNLRSFRPVQSAAKLGASGVPSSPLSVEGDSIRVDLRPYEWAEVEAMF